MLKTKEEIKEWLDEMKVVKYIINDDLTVDVVGNVYLDYLNIFEFPIQFRIVFGYFSCCNCELTSLKGCPTYVAHNFYCMDNNLKNLDYSPENVSGYFCSNIGSFSQEEYEQFIIERKLRKRKEFLNSIQ